MNDSDWNENDNSELVQKSRIYKFDLDKRLVGLLIVELDRIRRESGRDMLSLTDAMNDAIATYIVNLKAHDFAHLN